jgi:hypothetical protein
VAPDEERIADAGEDPERGEPEGLVGVQEGSRLSDITELAHAAAERLPRVRRLCRVADDVARGGRAEDRSAMAPDQEWRRDAA